MEDETEATSQVAEVLRDAANHMATYGFVQGEYWNLETGDTVTEEAEKNRDILHAPCCARGAILAVVRESGLGDEVADGAIEAMNAHVGGYVDDFNDEDGRTQDEVIDALRDCAEVVDIEGRWV